MTVITSKRVATEEGQGSILFQTDGTTRMTVTHGGVVSFAANPKDAAGNTIAAGVGGVASITSGSAATAGGTSALSAFTIAHGLGATPTFFNVIPNNAQSVAAASLGGYVTADATNVYYNTISSVTASKIFTFVWSANP